MLEGPDQNGGSLVNRTGVAEEKAAKALYPGTQENLSFILLFVWTKPIILQLTVYQKLQMSIQTQNEDSFYQRIVFKSKKISLIPSLSSILLFMFAIKQNQG